ncbi:MAG TPA: alpha-glucuronidase family glycosyl hydrolase, partial [Mucilaginibacter sp.]
MTRFLFRNGCVLSLILFAVISNAYANNGYKLWLEYSKINNPRLADTYRQQLRHMVFPVTSDQQKAARKELLTGLDGMLSLKPDDVKAILNAQTLVAGTPQTLRSLSISIPAEIGNEGYLVKTVSINEKKCTIITANTDVGLLYGVFNFLKLIQTGKPITNLDIADHPRITYRILDHWDNLNRTIERGYAGSSIWNWHKLPDVIDQRYIDYARANTSVGINGSVINNVNSDALILSTQYLVKIRALANVFRVYGIKIYISVKFSSPVELGGLKTADPLDAAVKKWWADKAD